MQPLSISLSLLFFLTSSSSALPNHLYDRQGTAVPPPTTDNTTDSPSGNNNGNQSGGGGGVALEIIIPIIVILVVAIVCVTLVHFRSKLPSLFRSFSLPTTSTAALQPISTRDSLPRTVTADQLSGTTTPLTGQTSNTTHTTTTAASTSAERRARRARDRERNVRRTESGRSVKTLPVYSKEAGDEELVLVRQRSQSSFSSGSYSDEEGNSAEGPEGDIERGLLPSHRRSSSTRSARTLGNQDEMDIGNAGLSPVGETHESQGEEIELDIRTPSPTTPRPLPSTSSPETPQRSESLVRRESLARRSWGLTPTYLEAMSAPLSYPSPSEEVPPPRNLRTRTSSTFGKLLSRAGFNQQAQPATTQMLETRRDRNRQASSSTSLLLQPTTSRASSSFAFGRSKSPSTSTTPWESTASLLISSPVPNTAVRASFDSTALPRAGLSDDQMKFLSSKEAIGLTGKRIEDVPEYKRRRRSRTRGEGLSVDLGEGGRSGSGSRRGSVSTEGSPEVGEERLPSWEMSENERRNNEAFERRGLSRPPEIGVGVESEGLGLGLEVTANEDVRGSGKEQKGEGEEGEEGESTFPTINENTTIPRTKPLPAPIRVDVNMEMSTNDGPTSSPNTFMTAPRTPLSPSQSDAPIPTMTRTTDGALTATPRLEVEPPTPVVSTPPSGRV
ncbi:hypothetical protein I302_106655 [Kwoniella bestiolae CBS 10118]|uniref:Uncharacterized protein n=1 Tax=Kwoniella bestiolae CBS 10118 TaxID=1296100 RepID=A0A1B9G0S4_9TREE|nr:hypothetical protein I302_06083 [Kwoniella bestiolae CBS 10118]OCF24622.1 hypothetical protein I302_06083 [Kwoniella bestiolae CBS 10118]